MKRTALFALAGVALLGAAACSKTGVQEAPKGITAIAEDFSTPDESTKSEFDFSTPGKAQFKWSAGDKIAIAYRSTDPATNYHDGMNLTLTGGAGSNTGTFGTAEEITAYNSNSELQPQKGFYAVYPAGAARFYTSFDFTGEILVNNNDLYSIGDDSTPIDSFQAKPILVYRNSSSSNAIPDKPIEFQHVAAILKLSISDIPAGVQKVRITFPGQFAQLRSGLKIDEIGYETRVAASADDLYSSIAFSFEKTTATVSGETTFYSPMCFGTYESGFKVELIEMTTVGDENVVASCATAKSCSVGRGQMACIDLKVEADGTGYKMVSGK